MSKRKLLMTASVWVHIRNFHIPYLKAFQQLGWETHVACAGIPENAPYVDVGIDVPFEKRITSPGNFRVLRQLCHRIREEYYDLIIAHTTLASFFTRLAVKGMPSHPKLVNVVHGYLFDDATLAPKRAVLLGAEKLTAPETDLLLTMNQWDDVYATRNRLGKRVGKIPGMGVDFSRLDSTTAEAGKRLRKSLDIPEDAFVLVYAAEFSERKSQQVLIRAMQYLPHNAVLALCGSGATFGACRDLAVKLGVAGRVLFPGQVENMSVWYRMADAGVSASRYEGLPFNIMEAMYCGLPVVASRVKGHVDLIEDGVNGLLYPYGDANACARQVARLMGEPRFLQSLATASKASVEAYRLEAVLPDVMARYLSLPDGTGSA